VENVKMHYQHSLLWLRFAPRAILFSVVALASGLASGGSWAGICWQSGYAEAMNRAEQEGKLLFVLFYESDNDRLTQYFESKVLDCKPVLQGLKDYVCVKLCCDASLRVDGKQIKLLAHPAFAGLNGRPGFAILDFTHKDSDYYGCVVSAFAFSTRRCYSARQMAIILDLPPGRPEQRRAAYLVRTRLFPGRNRSSVPVAPCLQPSFEAIATAKVEWLTDYAQAMTAAETRKKMLLVYFCDCGAGGPCARFKAETLDHAQVRHELQNYVCLQVPLDAKIVSGGQEVTLLQHAAFREMLGQPGIAILDFVHSDPQLYGMTVSTFPITGKLWYTPEQMAVILDLPPGTLTQRTLIYAVRTHPEKPASTDGELSQVLLQEAQDHSQYQAALRLQGHHHWETRFHRIVAALPGGLTAKEVCAESWPGDNLVEAAIECVRCWRLSDGHWSAVRAKNRCYGYDMKCGTNGVWYATGIFGTK
jgi:hypothetical protein